MRDRATPTDLVQTVATPASASILILGSKFLAYLAPSESAESSEKALELRTRRYPDASHHCWAHRIGRPLPLIEHSADAGEPSGTAGRPILDALRSARLENVVCVVSRYFGGTKLGTGGLVRAYGDAARSVIAEAQVETGTVVRLVTIEFDHERTGIVYRALEEFGITLREAHYDERAHGVLEVPLSQVELVRTRIHELAHVGIDWSEGDLRIR